MLKSMRIICQLFDMNSLWTRLCKGENYCVLKVRPFSIQGNFARRTVNPSGFLSTVGLGHNLGRYAIKGRAVKNDNVRIMDTLSKVQSMLSQEYDLPLDRLNPEQALAELGIDSLTTIEFMFKLEDEFAISLSEERGSIRTVRDISILVDAVRQRGAA